ncbi:MAG: HU family DNA-binding protein [Candidatus Omnitrophota bacterium]|jgi:DNA-binding protein HU-beta
MNKAELIEVVSKNTCTKKEAQEAVEAVFDAIRGSLKKQDPVAISGFGTFKVKETKARMGRNPKTGEAIQISAKKKVAFKASKDLKEML